MRTAIGIFTMILLLATTACKGKKDVVADQSSETTTSAPFEVIRYVKTPCFGTCPQFTMAIRSDGFAFYEGKMFVEMEGSWRGQWSQKQIEAVLLKAEEIGYTSLDPTYDNRFVTDLPSTTTVLTFDGEPKSVLNRYDGPKELAQLYILIDGIIEDVKWTQDTDN